jgi:hypothetical protein
VETGSRKRIKKTLTEATLQLATLYLRNVYGVHKSPVYKGSLEETQN